MHLEVLRLDLRRRRLALTAYAFGIAAYTLLVVAIYPSFKNSTSLNDLTKGGSAMAALFGATGSLTSQTGWLDVNLYKNFLPLVVLLITIGYGASSVAGLDEIGVLGLVATLPLTRRRLAAEKVAAMVLQGLLVAVAAAVCVEVGHWFQLAIPAEHLLGVTVAVTLLGVDLGLLTMAVGAFSGNKAGAIGLGAAVGVASYVVSSLSPVASWIRPARDVSLFYWAVGKGQTARGVSPAGLLVLCVVGAVLVAVTVAAFDRMDIR
ncbi:MAG: ABC transporter permease [Actinomycetota bacterium]